MDFVVLLAQEHETVLAYINKGSGDFSFDQKVIYAAPHPNWGSSGIQLVDLDKDGDLDVLLTHGDTFDDGIVKPYHGIQWLENTGGYPFVEHTLAQMPGVHRAQAADLDGDGDLDIVACALLAGGSDVDEKSLPALVWLEQTTRGTFVRHTIEMGIPAPRDARCRRHRRRRRHRHRRRQLLDRQAIAGLGRRLDESADEAWRERARVAPESPAAVGELRATGKEPRDSPTAP